MKKFLIFFLFYTYSIFSLVVFVQDHANQTSRFDLKPQNTINHLMHLLVREKGIDRNRFNLLLGDQILDGQKKLQDYNIQDNTTLKLVISSSAGFRIRILYL